MRQTTSETLIQQGLTNIIAKYGEWTDHNIELPSGHYTIGPNRTSDKLRRIVQIVADLGGGEISKLRILDLACLEGQYGIEFARHGATVVAVEGREANVAKARFAATALNLTSIEFIQGDVRNVSSEDLGQFDVVLCLGILYHLDGLDIPRFLEKIYSLCRRVLIIDTYVSVVDQSSITYKAHAYYGRYIVEHPESASNQERLGDLWASIGNSRSFWITRPSLLNLLANVGFSSCFECMYPFEVTKPADRLTVAALKGEQCRILNIPRLNEKLVECMPESPVSKVSPQQRAFMGVRRGVSRCVPGVVRRKVKSVLRRLRLMPDGIHPWEWKDPWRRR